MRLAGRQYKCLLFFLQTECIHTHRIAAVIQIELRHSMTVLLTACDFIASSEACVYEQL